MNPKVFISHAHEDKERFVRKFAHNLVEKGIDVWLDEWEMLPGDSLVDKIFEEGLKNASAIIVIISSTSINKAWVREELNAAVIKRIQKKAKLIPVIIDPVIEKMPEVLRTTVYVQINDFNNYSSQLDSIYLSLTGKKDKSNETLNKVDSQIFRISDLSEFDSQVLKIINELVIKEGQKLVALRPFPKELLDLNISIDEIKESLEVLAHNHYLKASWDSGGLGAVILNETGFHEYAKIHLDDYSQIIELIAAEIVNSKNKATSNFDLQKNLNLPLIIIELVLDIFESNNLVQISKMTSNYIVVYNHSPELKRRLLQL